MSNRQSRYEVLLKLASGGMGTVYVGRVRSAGGFSRLVAIKRTHPHLLEDPKTRRMMAQEAALAARIHHTHVVSVLDVEETDRELQLVMDYVEGASLSQLEKRTRGEISAPIVVRILLDACAGLHAAHELKDDDGRLLGVVHRDVSPHNILVGSDGVAKLADFGIAKVLHASNEPTSTGVVKGKLSYIAPEYVSRHLLDARSDVFALGAVLWEALARRSAFRGQDQLETLARIKRYSPPKISEAFPEHAGFDHVAARAMAKDPDERFQSAKAFADELSKAALASGSIATHEEVATFLLSIMGPELEARRLATRDAAAALSDEQSELRTESLDLAPVRDRETPVLEASKTTNIATPSKSGGRALAFVLLALGALAGAIVLVVALKPKPTGVVTASTPVVSTPIVSTQTSNPAPASTIAPAPASDGTVDASTVATARPVPKAKPQVPNKGRKVEPNPYGNP